MRSSARPRLDLRSGARLAQWLWAAEPSFLARAASRCLGFAETAVRRAAARPPAVVRRLPRTVVSVGNLTVGGTGKTPMVRWVVGALRGLGRRPALLARGYGAPDGAMNDEMRETLDLLPDLPVGAGADRFATATRLLASDPAIDVFVLDDGFSHRTLHRDLDLLLADAAAPLGNGHLLPRGPLREPPEAAGRAHAVLLTRAGRAGSEALARSEALLRAHAPAALFVAVDEACGPPRPAAGTAGDPPRSPLLLCGIARPEPFLEAAGERFPGACAEVVAGDHFPYDRMSLTRLAAFARRHGADGIVTTGKDAVKLRDRPPADLPLWILPVESRPRDPGRLADLLAGARS